MTKVFEELANLDRLVHEPARLSIMTAVSVVQSADFTFLQRITGLSMGNLSNHLAKLEEGGMIKINKGYANNRPNTTITITPLGKETIDHHWQQLQKFHEESKKLKKDG
ncbi:MAG: transcriptional regulator [Anaerolineaceae bacterium]